MRSSSASAFPRSCGVISAIEHPGLEAAGGALKGPGGALKDPGGALDGPGAFIRGWRHAGRMWRHAGRIEPFAPAAPDLNCLDIDVSHRAARPGARDGLR
jgi:hypothetical protein